MLIEAGLPVETIVEKLAINPRKILNLPVPDIEEGEEANLVLFDLNTEWVFDRGSNKSKSSNSPYFGKSLKGKVLLACNKGQVFNNF
jgi:dihydroorotase